MNGPALPSRRSFCAGCCLLLGGAALRARTEPEAPPEPSLVLTRETRASMVPGTLRDYRKEGRFFLLADAAGIYALTAICTHRGCTVHAQGDEGFGCPCHDSEYDRQGAVLQGPALRPLRHFPVRESAPGGPLAVDLTHEADPLARL